MVFCIDASNSTNNSRSLVMTIEEALPDNHFTHSNLRVNTAAAIKVVGVQPVRLTNNNNNSGTRRSTISSRRVITAVLSINLLPLCSHIKLRATTTTTRGRIGSLMVRASSA